MNKTRQLRAALSMLELIFVIVILGIVSSIGAEVIAQTYESYIVQRGQYRATTKTELALNQIANRLRYAIPGTVGFKLTKDHEFQGITEPNSGNDAVLQWVAYDGDSFEAISSSASTGVARRPGWSGFCDLNASSGSTIATPGSDLNLASGIITNLGGSISNAVIYFPYGVSYGVNAGSGETITLDTALPSGSSIYERYKLAWSSYALVCENGNADYPCGDLYLYYNFTPTVGADLNVTTPPIPKSLLLTNVDNFRFKGSEGSLRVKICKREQTGMDANDTIHACKEKVIF